jgi:hypothetical protein
MKTGANLPERFGNEATVSSSSEYNINKKTSVVLKQQNHFVSSLNKTRVIKWATHFLLNVVIRKVPEVIIDGNQIGCEKENTI